MRIELCGNLSVQVDGRDAGAELAGRQGRLLLAYLVARRGEPVRRDELIDVVWQGRPPNAPEASLSSLLTGVRRALGPQSLTGRSVLTLTLPAGAWIDIEAARATTREAEAALAGGEPAEALARARAALALTEQPVLAEMTGTWVEHLRSEVAQLRCDLLLTAARAALELGEPVTAERLARSVIDLEPYRESGYGLLMEALARAGNVAEALLTFDRVRVMLREELGVPPAPALTALHERLLGAAPPAAAPRRAVPDLPLPGVVRRNDRRRFVAREAELRRLRGRWEQARGGQGALVLVTGEPGIGKSRLAARFAAEVHARGAFVTHGRSDEETVVPYQPFVEALRHLTAHLDLLALDATLAPLLDELGPLLPGIGTLRAPAEDGRYVLFEAAAALLERVARLRPLLLVLEDVHWADKPTLLLLRQLVRHAEAAPIMVLATYNDVALAPAAPLQRVLADLRRDQPLERILLTGLDVAATATLAGSDVDAARLREYTSGNPFFIEETLRAEGSVPESVREMLVHRCERLRPATLEILTLAAVLGRDFSLEPLERLAGRPVEEVLGALEEAADAGLIAEDTEDVGRFSFCHALVRDAVYARPVASRRRLLHLRAGEALEHARGATEVTAAELAHHFHLARHAGGSWRAAHYAVEAGEQAARAYAFEEASAHFERALDAAPEDDDELRMEAWLALGSVRWQGGEPGARAAYHAAAEIAQRRGDTATLVTAALGAGGRVYAPGRPDPAYLTLVETALEAVEPHRECARARLLGRLTEALPDSERRAQVSEAAVRLARKGGDGEAVACALLSRHAARLHARHLQERLALAEEAMALADRDGLRETAALARHWLAHDLMEAADVAGARRRHAELAALASELHQPLYQHAALAWRGVWAQLGGRLEEAERMAREGLRLAERAGAPDARANFTAQLLPLMREQGRLPELRGELQQLAAGEPHVLAWAAIAPLAHLDAGDTDRAAEAFAEAFAAVPEGLLWLPATAWLAEAAARLEQREASAVLLARLEPYSGRLVHAGFAGCWGAVDRLRGLLARAVGRPEEARRLLEAALETHRAIGAAPLERRTREELG
jgi:DNA-binding SARP family transcriptional activator